MFWLWNGLVFWFRLFFSLLWDGWSGILSRGSTWFNVGWDGMRMGKYVESWILAVCGVNCCTVFSSSDPKYRLYKLAVKMKLAICQAKYGRLKKKLN
jgi:hypothetical protein